MTQSPFVKSKYPRRKNDHYPTIDSRCVDALLESRAYKFDTIITDCCAPNGSGILDRFQFWGRDVIPMYNAYDSTPIESIGGWIVSNPPYKKGVVDKIIEAQIMRIYHSEIFGVAMLLRTGFDHAKKYKPLFKECPYYAGQLKLTFRPIWIKPRKGVKTKSPIHNYVWHFWTLSAKKQKFPFVLYSD